jgi:hypothetical protein
MHDRTKQTFKPLRLIAKLRREDLPTVHLLNFCADRCRPCSRLRDPFYVTGEKQVSAQRKLFVKICVGGKLRRQFYRLHNSLSADDTGEVP